MTGTASTDAKEIHDIYSLKVVVVPTALPNVRRDYPDAVFRTRRGKLQAVAAEIRRLHKRKAPVLVGTTSIDASEQISALLLEGDPVPHEVLNARPENAERENEIVAQAGRLRAVTIATNMAGRGTDIMLGGNMAILSRSLLQERLWQTLQSDEDESSERSATSIDRLLPSLSESELRTITDLCEQVANVLRPYCSADVKRHTAGGGLREWLHRLMLRALELDDRKETFPELATSTVKDALQRLQALLRPAMESEREMILELGGLHIIGTERHESRRVDNQLRGRAGRQGDPGCSRFFLSLEDPLFRVFGGDRIARLAEAFRLDETTPIESAQVARTLDNVQTNIEQYYADIRKQLFAYDEVLAKQRTVLYKQRNRLLIAGGKQLFGEGVLADTALGGLVGEWIRATIDEIIRVNQRDASKCIRKLMEFFPGTELDESMLQAEKGTQRIIEAVGYRLLQQRRTMEQVAPEQDVAVFRYLALTQHDQLWSEHLRKLALLRDMSALQSLRQVDPLQQYQSDGFVLFEEMLSQIRRNTIYSFFLYTPLGTANRHQ
ncbi:hypothetical protein F1559_004337 [Cyanidiococcus yangmingshanensis]|uniref:SecA family profile domain-containing protein n=1 Tax=Cyanidiococcus yangmingshanensis TaxID=2690220 RepID=A0A7J7ILH6_9RHOD|nr:hypothetical protein F1559_004337 [Cyanidiococcus yangmingshanensis]